MHSSIYQCPNCSRAVNFTSPYTTVKECVCGTVINRMNNGTFLPRPFPTIVAADNATVIAPGTAGQWKGKKFTVTGRFRVWQEETLVSYWTIIFQEESLGGYLVEGYGMYAIYLPKEPPAELTGDVIKNLATGHNKQFYGQTYMLLRKNHCKKWDVEGELYIPECGNTFITYDFSSPNGQVVHIIEYWPQVRPAFEVHYTDFTSLALTHTRTYENRGVMLNCTCGKGIHIVSFPYAQSVACSHCGTRYAYKNGNNFSKVAGHNIMTPKPVIKLGSVGTIKGIPYKVLGYIMKEERNQYKARWTEYTLFHETEGYAFLSEFEGHWIYLREHGKTPVPTDMYTEGFRYEGKDYDLFNKYSYNVISAVGEFAANPFNDGSVQCWEFISPPIMWAREQSPEEGIAWFKGHHIPARDIAATFSDNVKMPMSTGIGTLQPNGYVNLKQMLKYVLIAIGLLIVIHLFTTGSTTEKQLVDTQIYFADSSNTQTTVIEDVRLEQSSSSVKLLINSSLNNTWVEVEATLVNKDDGSEYTVSKGIEYYSGMEDGESWSEGNLNGEMYLSSVPGGNYTLKLTATREGGFYPVGSYHVTAYAGATSMRNLFICIGLLLLWPIFKYITSYYSEKKRWANSDYSKFNYGSE
ncbi:DUF4178 domain-containing protein [Chitinophaga agri]|uniref:DUF4178 domain-containing protein n=1 Tax=Chitinophaga agri TaxID=2703787 RepID=A0A6B9ZJ19_9BACT|nr:DUF4178 domain-containing protein [Chitinophaga agri]QHS62400.1 DUF4178 domain-containing protein [Chitinophaga agri]